MSKARDLADIASNDVIATTASGIDVTGTVTADGLTVDGVGIFSTSSPNIRLDETDTTDLNTRFRGQGGVLKVETTTDAGGLVGIRMEIDHSTGDISFYEDTGTTPKFFWDASAESLGIGTSSPSAALDVVGDIEVSGKLSLGEEVLSKAVSYTSNQDAPYMIAGSTGYTGATTSWGTYGYQHRIKSDAGGAARVTIDSLSGEVFYVKTTGAGNTVGVLGELVVSGDLTVDTSTLHVDSTNNRVGIGTTSPDEALEVNGDLKISGSGFGVVQFGETSDQTKIVGRDGSHATLPNTMEFYTNSAERMRIDASGSVLVGKTASDGGITSGFEYSATIDVLYVARAGASTVFNRLTTDGDITIFRKDGANVGSIGVADGHAYLGGVDTGLRFDNGNNDIRPWHASALAYRDNVIDLGSTDARFDNIFATNGTIQTSDRNEKQDIAALTPTEMLVAARLSPSFKNFKWKSAIAEKGLDAARMHSGIIAQDVQDAFTAEGLDAGDYAMFISGTWWEAQTDVPAVEAVAEVLDEDGVVVNEAVEAKDASTRTDTYDTLEEAPEGATERTRLGIRYPELLAFVAAYSDQRFLAIEARLTALEA